MRCWPLSFTAFALLGLDLGGVETSRPVKTFGLSVRICLGYLAVVS